MRVAGGAANSARYQVLGASSVSIPFKEVAQALQRGTVMSSKAWNGLPEDIQNIILAAWNDNIDSARQIVADRQESAAEEEKQNGVEVVGSPGDLSRMREKLMQEQDRLVTELKVAPALVEKAQAALGN